PGDRPEGPPHGPQNASPASNDLRAPLNSPVSPQPDESRLGLARNLAECLVTLVLGVLLARTYVAEAYIVPTGSMAPTLLGMHPDLTCPTCGFRFALGMDSEGRSGRPVCPNCGQTSIDVSRAQEASGDRLLVQKFLYEIRPPKRWEAAVFQNPAELGQAYVKR